MHINFIKKILIKVDKVLFRGKFKNLYLNQKRRRLENRLERRLVSSKSDLYNYSFSFFYAKNEHAHINKLCDLYGTDKGESKKNNHPYEWKSSNYADLYEMLFRCRRKNVQLLIECGIGTNNINLESSMGINGKPGASLRMWRDYFPSARIIGVDIDKDILFNEERIETFYCDQLKKNSIENFTKESNLLENSADVIIDDGLHTFEAAVSFFEGMIKFLNEDGVYVIEDVPLPDMILYKDYYSKLTNKFTVHFIKGNRPTTFYACRLLVIFKNNV